MMHTLGSAAKLTGKSKSTLLRAIKSGRMSGVKDEGGNYQIETSELLRVFPATPHDAPNDAPRTGQESGAVQAEIARITEERDRERRQFQETIDDLRRRLDQEAEERRKLTAMLTDQRAQSAPPKGFFGRLFGGK